MQSCSPNTCTVVDNGASDEKFTDCSKHLADRETTASGESIDRRRAVVTRRQDPCRCSRRCRRNLDPISPSLPFDLTQPEGGEDIVDSQNGGTSICQQAVGSGRSRVAQRAWYRHHLPIAPDCFVNGEQRTACRPRLDDDHDVSRCGDETISGRETPWRRGRSRRCFSGNGAGIDHPAPEAKMPLRIHHIGPSSDKRNRRRSIGQECALVRSTVDAECKARDDGHSRLGESESEFAGNLSPGTRCPPSADDGDGGSRFVDRTASTKQHRRRRHIVGEEGRMRRESAPRGLRS